MVGLDPVVGVLLSAMPGRRQQLLQHDRVGRRLIRDHLDRSDLGRADGPLQEPPGGARVATRSDEHVDDPAELIDRAVQVAPLASNLQVGLVDLPAVADGMPAGPSGLGQQRREPLDPPINGDVVDLNAAFGEELERGGIDRWGR